MPEARSECRSFRSARLWRSMQSSRSAADPRGPEPRGLDPLGPGPRGFAHRGLHEATAFPENSLVAFAAALELGCGIECDLRLTADGEIGAAAF